MIFATLGGVNAEGEEVLRMLFRFRDTSCGRGYRAIYSAQLLNLFSFGSTVKTATNEMICEQFFQTLTCH